MRTIVHISDLHFGRVDPAILAPLVKFIGEVNPDLVAVPAPAQRRAGRVISRQGIPSPRFRFRKFSCRQHEVPLHTSYSASRARFDATTYINADLQPSSLTPRSCSRGQHRSGVNLERWPDQPDATGKIALCCSRSRGVHQDRCHASSVVSRPRVRHVVGCSPLAMLTLADCASISPGRSFPFADPCPTADRYKIRGYSASSFLGASTSRAGAASRIR